MPEADDDGVAETRYTVGIRAQVAVVVTRGDPAGQQAPVGSICRIVTAPCLSDLSPRTMSGRAPPSRCSSRPRFGCSPVTVRKVRDRLVDIWRPGLVDAQVRGRSWTAGMRSQPGARSARK